MLLRCGRDRIYLVVNEGSCNVHMKAIYEADSSDQTNTDENLILNLFLRLYYKHEYQGYTNVKLMWILTALLYFFFQDKCD